MWRKDTCGRVLSILFELANARFNLINIYAPTNLSERKTFFETLHQFIFPSDDIVIGGDFNCYDHELDKFGSNISIANYLSDFRSSFKLIDIWRKLHRKTREMSWWNANLTIGSRFDKFFVSNNLTNFVRSCDISPCCLSEHDYVNVTFDFKDLIPRGPGIWKFNNSLLGDEIFCDFISERISDLSSCRFSFDYAKVWWDFFKESLKYDVISFAKEKRRKLNHERVLLTNNLISLKHQLLNDNNDTLRSKFFLLNLV